MEDNWIEGVEIEKNAITKEELVNNDTDNIEVGDFGNSSDNTVVMDLDHIAQELKKCKKNQRKYTCRYSPKRF